MTKNDDREAAREKQYFERFPALATHLQRMAVSGTTGSPQNWSSFLQELNQALAAKAESERSGVHLIAAEIDRIQRLTEVHNETK